MDRANAPPPGVRLGPVQTPDGPSLNPEMPLVWQRYRYLGPHELQRRMDAARTVEGMAGPAQFGGWGTLGQSAGDVSGGSQSC